MADDKDLEGQKPEDEEQTSDSAAAASATGGSEVIVGTEQADLVVGEGGDNRIEGRGGDDTIVGGSGDDRIDGGEGMDTLFGGSGDDTIRGGDHDDRLFGGSGDDVLKGEHGRDFIVAGSGDDVLEGGLGSDDLYGGSGDDTIRGGADDDDLEGGGGDDSLYGGEGDDTLTGGAGADKFFFTPGGGADTIEDFDTAEDTIALSFGTALSFTDLDLSATADGTGTIIDLTARGGGTITLEGVLPADLTADHFEFLEVNSGDEGDQPSGGSSATLMPPGWSPDATTGSPMTFLGGGDTGWKVTGSAYGDTFIGGEGDDTVAVLGGDDLVLGNEGDDDIDGGAGDDTIFGGEGDDTIDAGTGTNYVHGGAGADTFVVQPGQTQTTTIADFTDGSDQIDLSAISGITGFGDLTITDDNGIAVIDLSSQGAGTIRLRGVATTDLDADDFVFAAPAGAVDDGL